MEIKSTKFQQFTFSNPVIFCSSFATIFACLFSRYIISINFFVLLLIVVVSNFFLWYGIITYRELLKKFKRISLDKRNEIKETHKLIISLTEESKIARNNYNFDDSSRIIKRALVHVSSHKKLIDELTDFTDEYEEATGKFKFKDEFIKIKDKVIYVFRNRVS